MFAFENLKSENALTNTNCKILKMHAFINQLRTVGTEF